MESALGARSGVAFSQPAYESALTAVLEDIRIGTTLGIRRTPTLFVNGVELRGLPTSDQFEAIIAHEMHRLGKP